MWRDMLIQHRFACVATIIVAEEDTLLLDLDLSDTKFQNPSMTKEFYESLANQQDQDAVVSIPSRVDNSPKQRSHLRSLAPSKSPHLESSKQT